MLSMLISIESILHILFLEKYFFLKFYQYSPIERGCVRVVVVEDVAPQEVGYLLDEGVVV